MREAEDNLEIDSPFRAFCEEFHISPATGYRAAADGRLELVKQGNRTFVTKRGRQQYVASLKLFVSRATQAR